MAVRDYIAELCQLCVCNNSHNSTTYSPIRVLIFAQGKWFLFSFLFSHANDNNNVDGIIISRLKLVAGDDDYGTEEGATGLGLQ